jgi:hypothetical protein
LRDGGHWRNIEFVEALHAKVYMFRVRVVVNHLKDMWTGVPWVLTEIGSRVQVVEERMFAGVSMDAFNHEWRFG